MAKQPAQDTDAAEASAPAAETLSLNEFCLRLSSTDRRVEMIGAFESGERKAGRLNDTADAYAARYQEFLNQPA